MLTSVIRLAAPRVSRAAVPLVRSLATHARPAPARRVGGAVAAALLGGSLGGSALSMCLASDVTATADSLFESNQYGKLVDLLRDELSRKPEDVDVLWRLARALKKSADPLSKTEQEPLLREALALAERAIKADASRGPAHKWYAICLSQVGSFGSTSDKIKNSFVVRDHFEQAATLSPTDATSKHLLGLWCFEVAKLSWIEKKAAAALFASPPTATFEEAIDHLLAAEQTEPDFYPKNQLLLAQAYAKAGDKAEARTWLARCLAATPKTPEDEETIREASQLKI
uniref:Regulator of microtubule dynamics protein 1 n=1 Tax=Prymnesium polylepis TaxID=72548 RepID=A0A7S4M1Y9_9EUKA